MSREAIEFEGGDIFEDDIEETENEEIEDLEGDEDDELIEINPEDEDEDEMIPDDYDPMDDED